MTLSRGGSLGLPCHEYAFSLLVRLGDLKQKYQFVPDRTRFLSKPLSRGPLLRAVRDLLDNLPQDDE